MPRAPTPPLPPYEPPLAPLNAPGHNALLSTLKTHHARALKTHLQHAEEKLTISAGEVNERLTDARVRADRARERKRARRGSADGAAAAAGEDGGLAGADEGEDEQVLALEEQVGRVTRRLDERMRLTIDAEAKVDAVMRILGGFERQAEVEAVSASNRHSNASRSTRRRARGEGEGEGEDENEDEDEEARDRERMRGYIPPSQKLDHQLSEDAKEWDAMTLTERYAANNAYTGFYRIIHEAKHPGEDIPPLPHASTWFAHLEDTSRTTSSARSQSNKSKQASSRSSRRHPHPQSDAEEEEEEDEDLAIASERISLKCPLTLLPFRDPVTSTKCPHSFEREAIESMIASSSTTVAAPNNNSNSTSGSNRSVKRVRSVKCPVCSVVLTNFDLRSDPVLMRRVRRAEAAELREQEEEEDDEDEEEGSARQKRRKKSGILLASDDGLGDGDDDEEEDEEGSEMPVRSIKQEMSQG